MSVSTGSTGSTSTVTSVTDSRTRADNPAQADGPARAGKSAGLGARLRRLTALAASTVLLTSMSVALAPPSTPATEFPYNGADVSWPQCPVGTGLPMPSSKRKFVIFGLTHGYGFTLNPCLADQVAWAKERGKYLAAYSFTGAASPAEVIKYARSGPYKAETTTNAFRNSGYAAAKLTITEMADAKLAVPFVWLDIEPSLKRPWRKSLWKNGAYIDGQIRAYTEAGMKVGFYLSASTYDSILPKDYAVPEWRTVGPRPRTDALVMCTKPSVQGGTRMLSQWWNDTKDFDLICPKQRTWAKLKIYFAFPS
jgi:hypothetical protein